MTTIPFLIATLVAFVMFYGLGLSEALKKRYTVRKHSLPKIIKQILFLGTFNKYTLNAIIYQTTIVLMTILNLTFGLLGYYNALVIYYVFGFILLFIEGVYLFWLSKVDR